MGKASSAKIIEFRKLLVSKGLSDRIIEFDQSTRSAQDAAQAIGCDVGQIVKSLVFKTKKSEQAILVLTSGSNRVDEKALRIHVGEKLGKADADFVRENSGFSIGGVPPFGHAKKFPVYIDKDLFKHKELWATAGSSHTVFALSPDALLKSSGGKVIDVRGNGR